MAVAARMNGTGFTPACLYRSRVGIEQHLARLVKIPGPQFYHARDEAVIRDLQAIAGRGAEAEEGCQCHADEDTRSSLARVSALRQHHCIKHSIHGLLAGDTN